MYRAAGIGNQSPRPGGSTRLNAGTHQGSYPTQPVGLGHEVMADSRDSRRGASASASRHENQPAPSFGAAEGTHQQARQAGKQRRLSVSSAKELRTEASEGSSVHSPRDSTILVTPGKKTTRDRCLASLLKGQSSGVEQILMPVYKEQLLGDSLAHHYVWSPAKGSSGGMALLIHRDLKVEIVDHYADLWGRWAWVKMKVEQVDWAIAIVYVPVKRKEREIFMRDLPYNLPNVDNIMVGDWNQSVDDDRARSRSSATASIPVIDFMTDFQLTDPFRLMHPLDDGFTWFTLEGKGRRLDYFLVCEAGLAALSRISYSQHPLSEHSPITAELQLGEPQELGKGYFRLNTELLADPKLKQWVENFWVRWSARKERFASLADWWEVGSKMISKLLSVFSRVLAFERNKQDRRYQRRVEYAQERMRAHPISALTWGKERAERLEEWKCRQQERAEIWSERLKVKGIVVYDRMSKESFQRLLPRRSAQLMQELAHPFGDTEPRARKPAELCDYAACYYKDILTSRRIGEGVDSNLVEGSDHCHNLSARLPPHGRLDLDRPITMEEELATLSTMAKGKAPGDDGLPVEFYATFWSTFGNDLVEIYNEILMEGQLPTSACSLVEEEKREEHEDEREKERQEERGKEHGKQRERRRRGRSSRRTSGSGAMEGFLFRCLAEKEREGEEEQEEEEWEEREKEREEAWEKERGRSGSGVVVREEEREEGEEERGEKQETQRKEDEQREELEEQQQREWEKEREEEREKEREQVYGGIFVMLFGGGAEGEGRGGGGAGGGGGEGGGGDWGWGCISQPLAPYSPSHFAHSKAAQFMHT
ncbi:hypothetical protein CBR_g39342 [Chara braunii]|uniref:Endonuclease/exonuclease/phosphatase domain-containing protein n=1 Tax=Chara braunii TaxID=69332 RepID=A0A388LRC3_CHABU|nr:hypothetical protein CBR_g39342 [Chara braunii]|eukprot:GBG84880.1 hypothetical protein CBR_g39342 [Chara braunii]